MIVLFSFVLDAFEFDYCCAMTKSDPRFSGSGTRGRRVGSAAGARRRRAIGVDGRRGRGKAFDYRGQRWSVRRCDSIVKLCDESFPFRLSFLFCFFGRTQFRFAFVNESVSSSQSKTSSESGSELSPRPADSDVGIAILSPSRLGHR